MQPRLPLTFRAAPRRITPRIFQKMIVAEIARRNKIRAINDRSGVCVCGRDVALHFDERNRKIACEDVR